MGKTYYCTIFTLDGVIIWFFKLEIHALIRVSDIYENNCSIEKNVYIHDKKSGKPNNLYLRLIESDLHHYWCWIIAKVNGSFLQQKIRWNILLSILTIRLWLKWKICSVWTISGRTPCARPVHIGCMFSQTITSV